MNVPAAAQRSEELPLSFPQFVMWLQHQQAPTSPVCTIGFGLRARGPLDVGALRHAVQVLVDRHPMLRTTFHLRDGEVSQSISDTAVTLDVHPYADPNPPAIDTPTSPIALQIARPFDLETGPLFRVALFTDGTAEHMVLISFHHIVGDGWSTGIMISELLSLYGAAAENLDSGLERPAATYGDFVRWQAAEIDSASGERQWSYWRDALAAPRQRSVLPSEIMRPATPRFVGAAFRTELTLDLVQRVKALATGLRTTAFVVLMGAFQLLVARLSGVRDVTTGMPARGRPKPAYLSVVGNFINLLPVRSRLQEGDSVREFLTRLHATVMHARHAQHYPLALMVQRLRLSGEETGQALFNTSFTIMTRDAAGGMAGRSVAGTLFWIQPLALQAGAVDLGLDVVTSDDGMHCIFKYSLDVLTAAAAADVAGQYVAMVDALTIAPDQPLAKLLNESNAQDPDEARAAALLDALGARDITLTLEGDRLRVNAPKGALDESARRAISAQRTAIIARLRASPAEVHALGPSCERLEGVPRGVSLERGRLITGGSDAGAAPDRGLCIHELLEISARLYPERTAVTGAGDELRYGVLDARSNQLARFLLRRGMQRGMLVAVCLERTVDMPVALAAVLKAGGAYVPLDPAHPRERLRGILRDAGAGFLITQNGFEDFAEGTAAQVILLDGHAADIHACSSESPGVAIDSADLAYVIYTSGSTGRPKGVEVEHRNVVALLEAMRAQPGLSSDDVLLAVTTVAFDIAGLELWLPLAVGARIVLATRAETLDGVRLAAILEAQAVSVMQATPAIWRLLVESGWTGRAALRALCGGEALPQGLAARLVGRVGELWNLYGPTETTIWSTAARITVATLSDGTKAIPIGRPIANTFVRIEDRAGNVVPVGVIGELLIGGAGVTRGYRHQPDLTARAFITRSERGITSRLYRTGDLVRSREDGQLEFIGRRDHQIKLRGYRIEPGEIEARLAQQSSIADCVVVKAGEPDDERLVAYLTLAGGASFDAQALRAELRLHLPDYMVPGHFVVMPAFALTPNGKLDRSALPPPEAAMAAGSGDEVTPLIPSVPMTPAQQRVAMLWAEVLHVGRVGLNDNFFDIGGHSLLLLKIHAGLKRDFGHELPLVELFQHTTVAQQARALEAISHA